MLWAGADPLVPGEEAPGREPDLEDGGLCALGFAALYRHFELLGLKGMKPYLSKPEAASILDYFSGEDCLPYLESMLKQGLDPNDRGNGGCSAIQRALEAFCQYGQSYSRFSYIDTGRKNRDLDSERSREFMKIIHMLAEAGGKWRPTVEDIKSARQSLTKMIPEYAVEFIWIMGRYQAANREDLEELIRTPTIKKVVGKYRRKINEYLDLLEVHDTTT